MFRIRLIDAYVSAKHSRIMTTELLNPQAHDSSLTNSMHWLVCSSLVIVHFGHVGSASLRPLIIKSYSIQINKFYFAYYCSPNKYRNKSH